jgi:hypothetical protein
MSLLLRSALAVAAVGFLLLASPARAQCPIEGCREYLGAGTRGSYFRVLVPENWDGDVFLVNHGLELDELTIAPHNVCRGGIARACTVDADCAGVGPGVCNKISMLGFEQFLPAGKAVAASTFSQISWAAFQSRFDLKDVIRFMRSKEGPGRPKRVIVTGPSGGGAVTVDATLRLPPGWIQGALPYCSASAGGLPTVDAATDLRLVYDSLCDGVPGGRLESPPDVGNPNHSTADQLDFALTVNTCLGVLFPSGDPVEAAAQADRLDRFVELTRFPATGFPVVHALGFSEFAMGDFVHDRERLNGRRPGWNATADYAGVLGGSEAAAFAAAVPRFRRGPGRTKMAKNTEIDFTRGSGRRVDYPILSFSGREDYIALPEFQKLYHDAATIAGKDHVMIWGSAPGHCNFTSFEMRAVVEEYLEWLDSYRTPQEDEPTGADVLARCRALAGASPAQCNFDTEFEPGALRDRIPARPDWPEAGRRPLR